MHELAFHSLASIHTMALTISSPFARTKSAGDFQRYSVFWTEKQTT